jgi:hypothetical protein
MELYDQPFLGNDSVSKAVARKQALYTTEQQSFLGGQNDGTMSNVVSVMSMRCEQRV